MSFSLHPRLAAGAAPVLDLPLSTLLLKDDSRWPWLILVPRRPALKEIHDLDADAATQLMEEVRRASAAVAALPGVEKVNVGALGNEVPQLHVHVIGRWQGDQAWPGPVWGVGGKTPYTPDAKGRLAATLQVQFRKGGGVAG